MRWKHEYLDDTQPSIQYAAVFFTENLRSLRLNRYEFYLVILPLGIRWALMRYHIKPLGMTKTQGFCQDFYWYDLFLNQ